jgi:hypothetical protein
MGRHFLREMPALFVLEPGFERVGLVSLDPLYDCDYNYTIATYSFHTWKL